MEIELLLHKQAISQNLTGSLHPEHYERKTAFAAPIIRVRPAHPASGACRRIPGFKTQARFISAPLFPFLLHASLFRT